MWILRLRLMTKYRSFILNERLIVQDYLFNSLSLQYERLLYSTGKTRNCCKSAKKKLICQRLGIKAPHSPEDMWEHRDHTFQMQVLWAPEYIFTLGLFTHSDFYPKRKTTCQIRLMCFTETFSNRVCLSLMDEFYSYYSMHQITAI